MNIKIHRGQNQIGGSIIEISSNTTKIILDAGSELDEKEPIAPAILGLFSSEASYNAVFISHYHGDHIGLCDKVIPEIPVYISKVAERVTNAARSYMKKPEYRFSEYYESEKPFIVGDIVITPYLCDHSAFEAYMFHVACKGKSILYTGDFRSHGRKSFAALLKRLPKVDVLITEGTTLNRTSTIPITEEELEKKAVNLISKTEGPVFVLMAATNIDRLVTIYKAARKTNRVLLQDLYLAEISTAAGGKIPKSIHFPCIRVFPINNAKERYEQLQTYGTAKIGRKNIANLKFVMCVRSSMRTYLEKLSSLMPFENGILFYSMWEGYKANDDMAGFISYLQGKGVIIVYLHTSGHADTHAIDKLIAKIKPKVVIPIHTENSEWFYKYSDIKVVTENFFSF